MLEFFSNKNIVENKIQLFFYERGLSPHVPPAGTAHLEPTCFWIENPSRNRFALNSISAKNPNIFFS